MSQTDEIATAIIEAVASALCDKYEMHPRVGQSDFSVAVGMTTFIIGKYETTARVVGHRLECAPEVKP